MVEYNYMPRRSAKANAWEQRLINYLKAKGVLARADVYLFGSRSRGDYTYRSDIDLAFENLPENLKLGDLDEGIDNLNIPYTVDLVNLDHVNKEFYDQCMSEAISLEEISN